MEKVLEIDAQLFEYLRNFVGDNIWLDRFWIALGVYLIYIVPIILIAGWFWSAHTKRVAFRAGFVGIIAWQAVSKIIAHLANRTRPAEAIVGVKELILHRPDTSFPSDHTAMIFAVALTVRLSGHRKLGNALLIIGALVAIGRVMIGVHFPLDVLAGAVVGMVTALVFWVLREPVDRYITEPFVRVMKKVHL